MQWKKVLKRFLIWRLRHVSDKVFIMILAVLIGFTGGLAAVVIKNLVHLIQHVLKTWFIDGIGSYMYLIYPVVGITIVIVFARYLLNKHVGHGIPIVLFSISKTKGRIQSHNMFSSVISSALTVGFGGSVGLEGPTVATGAAIGSNVGRLFHLNYKQIVLLLGCASTGAMAAIFKAPIAAIIFALEVIMLDLTMASLVPLLLASLSAVLTSYLFLGKNVLYAVNVSSGFELHQVWIYIALGVLAGFVSVYFTKMYMWVGKMFKGIKQWYHRLLLGGLVLGGLIFLFPSLYGEGYEVINATLNGNTAHLFENTFYANYSQNIAIMILIFVLVILMKVVATSVTFASGGVGGIFAPSLFIGANMGLMFSVVMHALGMDVSLIHCALVGMAGTIAGIIHAPLTAIFLIAEITGGYELFVPLMVVATLSYATVKLFVPNSVYTLQLAQRGELMTHHKDKAMLSMLRISELIEKNFRKVSEDASLRELVDLISKSSRNIFPVVDEEGMLKGIVVMDHIRHIMFKPEMYDEVYVRDLMLTPGPYLVDISDNMEQVAEKFQETGNFNLPVVDKGKYIGFISRARLYSTYRRMMKRFSED